MSLFEVNRAIERPDAALVEGLSQIAVANISDAMANLNTMDSGIQAISGFRICGPACTAVTPTGDFLPILKALHTAERGDVLVVDNQGDPDTALWGEITSTEAQLKGLAGLVLDGLVRDIAEIRELGFPVFARGTTPRVAGRGSLGEVNVAVRCGGTVIHPGDIIVGDTDGVVVVPLRKAEAVLSRAQSIVDHEEILRKRVADGVSQVEIYNLDEQFESLRQAHEE